MTSPCPDCGAGPCETPSCKRYNPDADPGAAHETPLAVTIEQLRQCMESTRASVQSAARCGNVWKARELAFKARRAYEDALCAAHPIQPGDVIKSSNGKVACVYELWVTYGGRVKMFAHLRKKDETFGLKQAPLWRYDWDNPQIIGTYAAYPK